MKMTQRDKVLLIFLGVIVVVALVIVLPEIGIMSCKDKMTEYQNKTVELDEELANQLTELRAMGVDAATADNYRLAIDRLEKKITEQKKEAARLAHSIMAFAESFDVDQQWIYGLEYKGGIAGEEDSKLINYDKLADIERSENTTEEYTVKGTVYTLQSANRTINYSLADNANCLINCQLILEGYSVNEIAAFLLYLQQITSKGSILINSASYDSSKEQGTITMTALMTATDGISRYADEIVQALKEKEESQPQE